MISAPPKQVHKPEQLEFASIAFPKDRKVLSVGEVANAWGCCDNHVIKLLEEGKLAGFDIAGRHEFLRLPSSVIPFLARALIQAFGPSAAVKFAFDLFTGRLKSDAPIDPTVALEVEKSIAAVLKTVRPGRTNCKSRWRVPIEGYKAFINDNHSQA